MSLGPKPRFGDIWIGDFPFDEWKDSKHRTLLVLAYRASTDEVFAVKISSSRSYSLEPGQFGACGSDKFFEKTGLYKDSKIVFNSLAVIPVAKLVKQLGVLEINDRKTSNRLMQAVKESRYASAIANAIRAFG